MTKSVYLAGELFSAKHIAGNALLAEAITSISEGRYVLFLPQNFEKRDRSPQSIRDEDLKMVTSSDVALIHYDGTELDSGTVVEYLFAKFADIPCVILRTDFRGESDGKEHFPWNLMTSFFPRTEVVVLNSQAIYQEAILANKTQVESVHFLMHRIATEVVAAIDRVIATEPLMPNSLRNSIAEWLQIFPGFVGEKVEI